MRDVLGGLSLRCAGSPVTYTGFYSIPPIFAVWCYNHLNLQIIFLDAIHRGKVVIHDTPWFVDASSLVSAQVMCDAHNRRMIGGISTPVRANFCLY